MWALILIIYMQSAQSLDQSFLRYGIVSEQKYSEQICNDEGKLLIGPILAETDPSVQFVWQGYKCVDMTK